LDVVEQYLSELREIRSSGEATDETSYYPAIEHLLNTIGGQLSPRVRCILTLKTRGAGHPDGGLFERSQFQRLKDKDPIAGQKPARGAIEIKSTADDAWVTAETEQVTKYWKNTVRFLSRTIAISCYSAATLQANQLTLALIASLKTKSNFGN